MRSDPEELQNAVQEAAVEKLKEVSREKVQERGACFAFEWWVLLYKTCKTCGFQTFGLSTNGHPLLTS